MVGGSAFAACHSLSEPTGHRVAGVLRRKEGGNYCRSVVLQEVFGGRENVTVLALSNGF